MQRDCFHLTLHNTLRTRRKSFPGGLFATSLRQTVRYALSSRCLPLN
ncbi:hypothetical protein [Zooshikella sp. RANM57]